MLNNFEFPDTLKQNYLKVSDLHNIWYGVENERANLAILSLHGGPGSRNKPEHLAFFRNLGLKIVVFDQRGAGQSTPSGETKDNTTQDLVADIEKLRQHLNIDKWIVAGASWGSALALVYAQEHPQTVLGLFLRNIFLARKEDDDWFLKAGGASKIFPDVWEKVVEYMQKHNSHSEDLLDLLYKKLLHGDENSQKEAALIHENWEGNIYKLEKVPEYKKMEDIEEADVHSSKIFMHYSHNNYFLEDNQLLKHANKIKHIPTVILHGRYDMVCPTEQAYLLHKALPNSVLEITNLDGHSLSTQSKILSRYMLKELLAKV